MCGIIGYIGPKNPIEIVLDGLKRLEYRGYDSAGLAGIHDGKIVFCKELGKIAILETEVKEMGLALEHIAIGQTRWATHGKPSKVNAHPHFNADHSLALVHNGIIENHEPLRRMLKEEGVKFVSETDTEVVAHLIGKFYQGNIVDAVKQVIPLLKGTFSIALIHQDFPDQILAIAHDSPLVVGIGSGEAFVASDPHAFSAHTREVAFLLSGEIAVVKADKLEVFDISKGEIEKKIEKMQGLVEDSSKGDFEHYTLKEIFEQPQTIRSALLGRFIQDYGTALFEGINFDVNELLSVERILILACGTSWHAGYLASYMLEDRARIPVQVEISSEFRYKNPVVPPGTLAIAISQSGETADTLAAVRELKAKGVKILAICNVEGSNLAREADVCIFLRAGQEIGVCSTKAFTSQVVVLALFTLLMARMRHMDKKEGQTFLDALLKLPDQVQQVLNQSEHIQKIAKKYAHFENFFYIGRSYMYPASLEGALKLKEISYINANGYPAGEMKHGPIALINENCPTVALCGNKVTYEKLLSNLMEIKARNGKILAIAEDCEQGLENIVDELIRIPQTIDELSGVLTSVACQLLAYYIAKERGAEIDQPRNLAKSVTVE
jgi:glucosamine--fructose-6-phosphate aminotransferase (isomerizing)